MDIALIDQILRDIGLEPLEDEADENPGQKNSPA
jgi:hypothetical protein